MRLLSFILLLPYLLTISCGQSSPGLVVTGRLEDTIPGWWIKKLNIDYSEPASHLVSRVVKAIKQKGEYLEFIEEGNNWGYLRYQVKIENDIFFFEISSDNQSVALTLDQPGIQYNKIIGTEYYKFINNNKYACRIVYRCEKDNTRLFLCGGGIYCRKIMILSGA